MTLQVLSGTTEAMEQVHSLLVHEFDVMDIHRDEFDDEDIVELQIEVAENVLDNIIMKAEEIDGYGGWYVNEDDSYAD